MFKSFDFFLFNTNILLPILLYDCLELIVEKNIFQFRYNVFHINIFSNLITIIINNYLIYNMYYVFFTIDILTLSSQVAFLLFIGVVIFTFNYIFSQLSFPFYLQLSFPFPNQYFLVSSKQVNLISNNLCKYLCPCKCNVNIKFKT